MEKLSEMEWLNPLGQTRHIDTSSVNRHLCSIFHTGSSFDLYHAGSGHCHTVLHPFQQLHQYITNKNVMCNDTTVSLFISLKAT